MADESDRGAGAAGRFYDELRRIGPSAAALAHGVVSIGQECLLTADEIRAFARRAGITAGTAVLDIGSGIGGPACDLAQQFGCHVVGVDISVVGHEQAVARARALGVEHLVEFRYGDIHAVALPPGAFDTIIGLDAWCHIADRSELLPRCAALLRSRGRVAFYDHVERKPMPEAERRRLHALWHFPGLESPHSYQNALAAAGLRLLYQEETSAYAVRFYSRLLECYRAERAAFESARGAARYQHGLERLELTCRLAVAGVLGQFGCIAEKAEDG